MGGILGLILGLNILHIIHCVFNVCRRESWSELLMAVSSIWSIIASILSQYDIMSFCIKRTSRALGDSNQVKPFLNRVPKSPWCAFYTYIEILYDKSIFSVRISSVQICTTTGFILRDVNRMIDREQRLLENRPNHYPQYKSNTKTD